IHPQLAPSLGRLLLLAAALLTLPQGALAQYKPGVTVVRDHLKIELAADGTAVEWREYSRRVDTASAVDRHGEARIPYSEGLASVEVVEAWTQAPDGSRIDVKPDQIRTMSDNDGGDRDFGDGKVKVIIFPAVAPGAVMHYRTKTTEHRQPFPGHYFFSRPVSPHYRFEDTRIRIEYPPEVKLRFHVSGGFVRHETGGPTVGPSGQKAVAEFRFRQDTAHPPEGNRLDLHEFAPGVLVSTFGSYAEFAKAYHDRAEPQAQATAEIRAQAADIVKGLSTERQKIQAIYQWVSRNIRYVYAHVGVGGWVPRPANQILETRWGDCKDHVAILEALLKAVGVDSSPALINSGESYSMPHLPVSSPLNHVITYVPAIKTFLDSTAEFAPIGVMPFGIAGKPALVTATGEVVHTPATHPTRDRTHARTVMRVKADGSIEGEATVKMSGSHEYESRMRRASQRDREQDALIDKMLGRFHETGSGDVQGPDPTDLSVPWVLKSTFQLDPMVNIPGPYAMTVPVGLAPGDIRDMLTHKPRADRRFPAACAASHLLEESELTFPTSVRVTGVPKDTRYASPAVQYSATYRLKGNTVSIRREMTANRERLTCDARDDEAWRVFLPVLQRDLRGQIFIR
ncbi:MAG: DUF3857 domain-containing transglutaminase family protein, partial [Betaproteobacteria bacterium]